MNLVVFSEGKKEFISASKWRLAGIFTFIFVIAAILDFSESSFQSEWWPVHTLSLSYCESFWRKVWKFGANVRGPKYFDASVLSVANWVWVSQSSVLTFYKGSSTNHVVLKLGFFYPPSPPRRRFSNSWRGFFADFFRPPLPPLVVYVVCGWPLIAGLK